MDENGKFIINHDCLLEIMNYVITDCNLKIKNSEQGPLGYDDLVNFDSSDRNFKDPNAERYDDLINFVLTDEYIMELFAVHHKRLYENLELDIALRITKLLLDLRINKLSSKQNECFWKSYVQSIRKRNPFNVELSFNDGKRDPAGRWNESKIPYVNININGILSNRTNAQTLNLDGKITAHDLSDICILNPSLRKLTFEGIEIDGSVSMIAPHCENLKKLKIKFNAEIGIAHYAPLVKLPNLENFIINGIQESGSQLLFFNELRKWHRPRRLRPLILTIEDDLKVLPWRNECWNIKFAAFDSLQYFHKYGSYTEVSYELCEISENSSLIEQSLVTVTDGECVRIKFDRYKEELEIKLYENSDTSQMSPLLKLPNLSRLVILKRFNDSLYAPSLPKILSLMIPKDSFSLKACKIHYGSIDELEAVELAKIVSIRFLGCHICKWNLIKFLNKLPNLQHVVINVRDSIDSYNPKLIFDLLTACKVQATVICDKFKITFKSIEKILNIEMKDNCHADILSSLAQLNNVTTLQISGYSEPASFNSFFEAFVTSNLSTIQELDMSVLHDLRNFKDICKVAEIQSIKKLKCLMRDTTGIEKLGELNHLEELEIFGSGPLVPLFTKLAEKNKIRYILCRQLDTEEVLRVSQIRSLKKLVCQSSDSVNLQSFTVLANSSVEELIFDASAHSLQELLSAFASNSATRIHHLEVQYCTMLRLAEITELKSLKSLRVKYFNLECAPILNGFPHLEHLSIDHVYDDDLFVCIDSLNIVILKSLPSTLQKLELNFHIGFNECKYLVELEKLESLKCSLRDEPGLEVLANIKNLKSLIIDGALGSLFELFRAFAYKSEPKLQELHTSTNICSDEIREISGIKSLIKLNMLYEYVSDNFLDLGRLTELKSFRIVRPCWNREDIESVLPIFLLCQKLQCATLEGEAVATNLASRINQILKSVRDPAIQGPLQLFLIDDSLFPNFHVDDIDEAYLNVYYSYDIYDSYSYAYVEFHSERRDSDNSQTFSYTDM